jgi:hypothetical protein
VPVENYTVSATADFGTVSSQGHVFADTYLATDASATFTNTFTPAEGLDLTLSKIVTCNITSDENVFPFQITLTDAYGNPLSDRDIQVVLPDKTTVYTTGEDGVLNIQLQDAQSAVIKDLPVGTQYAIVESKANSYTTTFQVTGGSVTETGSKSVSGGLNTGEDVTVQVTNQYINIVPTGVETETAPYVLLLIGSAAALVLRTASRTRAKRR